MEYESQDVLGSRQAIVANVRIWAKDGVVYIDSAYDSEPPMVVGCHIIGPVVIGDIVVPGKPEGGGDDAS